MDRYLSSLIPLAVCAVFAVGYAYFDAHRFFGLVNFPRPHFHVARSIFIIGAVSSALLVCIAAISDIFAMTKKKGKR